MHTRQKLFALAAVAMLVLTAFGPAVGAAVAAGNDSAANDDASGNDSTDDGSAGNDAVENDSTGLSVSATENPDGSGVVNVTYNGSAADGATVTVATADENATYDGTGSHTADNGTATLPAPANNSTVALEITVAYENATTSTSITLGDGPEEGDEFEYDEETTHGQNVAGYVHYLQSEDRMSGLLVAKFTTENNLGKPGFPEVAAGNAPWTNDGSEETEAENESDGNETDVEGEEVETEDGEEREPGKPDHAGNPHAEGEGDGQGPPAHANGNGR